MKKRTAAGIAICMSALIIVTACANENSSTESTDKLTTQEITTTEFLSKTTDATSTAIEMTTAIPTITAQETTTTAKPQQPKTDALPNLCTSRYGYYQLSEDEKVVYDQIVNAAKTFQQEVTLKRKLSKEIVDKVCNLVYLEENDLYYIKEYSYYANEITGIVSKVGLTYRYTSMTVGIINKDVDARVKQITAKITPQMDTLAKIKLFHDEIILNCNYSTASEYGATPYGALVGGQALCEGYSRAFALLCNKVGIENLFATSAPVNNEQHMWNMVKLNGCWYNIDLTGDDPISTNQNDRIGPDYICYNYFLFQNTEFGKPITLDNRLFTLPEATASQYNYFIYYGLYVISYKDFQTMLEEQVLKAIQNKEKYIYIKFATDNLYEQASETLTGQELNPLFDYIDFSIGSKHNYYYRLAPELKIIQIEISYN